MSLLVGLAIILYLVLANYGTELVTSNTNVFFGTLVCVSIAPIVCWTYFQTAVARNRFASSDFEQLERNSLITWAIFGFVTLQLGWQTLVTQQWGIQGLILIDEFVLLLPLLSSLVALLLIFELNRRSFDIHESREQNSRIQESAPSTFSWVRLELVGILAPAVALFGAKDLMECTSVNYWQAGLVLGILFLAAIQVFPMLVAMIWEIKPIEEGERGRRLSAICTEAGVANLRVWKLSNKSGAVNALVLGVLPWGRKLIVTDELLEQVNESQLASIIRHEVAHIRFGHLFWRLLIIVSPIVLCVCALGIIKVNSESNFQMVLHPDALVGLAMFGCYLAYIYIFLGWQARLMEFQADLFAADLISSKNNDSDRADSMIDSLRLFANENPEMFKEGGWLHPSLVDRITLLQRTVSHPKLGRRVHQTLVWSKLGLFVVNLSAVIGLLVVFLLV